MSRLRRIVYLRLKGDPTNVEVIRRKIEIILGRKLEWKKRHLWTGRSSIVILYTTIDMEKC
jgi:hypothetical protein